MRTISLALLVTLVSAPAGAANWPDLASPAPPVGGGERDAALVVHDGIGRNDDCPCSSGRKFKQCCMDRVEKKARAVRDAKLFGSRKS